MGAMSVRITPVITVTEPVKSFVRSARIPAGFPVKLVRGKES